MPRHKCTHASHRRRKRGCSSSSSSSVTHNYNFKKAVLIRKPKPRSRSSTPTPSWKITSDGSPSYATTPSASSSHTPRLLKSKQKMAPPLSARRLAATLWEMNELPSLGTPDDFEHRERRHRSNKFTSLSPHFSHRSNCTTSEKMNRRMKSNYRKESSILPSHRILSDDADDVAYLDSTSNASFMELGSENHTGGRSKSTLHGSRNSLKEANNAVITSRELLEVINRLWTGHCPSPCATLFSALYTELEKARLLINQVAYDSSNQKKKKETQYHHLVKRMAAEKEEREAVEAAIESVMGQLEVERKLRRRLQSVNKKLGRELDISRASLTKTARFLEVEKTNREVMEHIRGGATAGPADGRKTESGFFEREPSDTHEDIIYDRTSLFLPFSQTSKPARAGTTSSVDRHWESGGIRPYPKWVGEERESGMLSEEEAISENRRSRKWIQFPGSAEREDGGKQKQGWSLKKGLKQQIFSRLGYSAISPSRRGRSLSAIPESWGFTK